LTALQRNKGIFCIKKIMNKNNTIIAGVLGLVVGLGVGYWYGGQRASKQAYEKAVSDIKAQQEEIAKKAGEDAADKANPFKVENPLEGVKANPFSDAKKALNPFAD